MLKKLWWFRGIKVFSWVKCFNYFVHPLDFQRSLGGECFQRGWWEFLTARLLPPAWLGRVYRSVTTFDSPCGIWRAGGWGEGWGSGGLWGRQRPSPGAEGFSSSSHWKMLLFAGQLIRKAGLSPGFLLLVKRNITCPGGATRFGGKAEPSFVDVTIQYNSDVLVWFDQIDPPSSV